MNTRPPLRSTRTSKGATNPAGLVKATVRVFKFSHGAWHKVTAARTGMNTRPSN